MEEFPAGTDVTLTVDHSSNGTALVVSAANYEVLDAAGNILVAFGPVSGFIPSRGYTLVTIDRAINTITDKIDLRQVNVQLVTTTGNYSQTIFYKIAGDTTRLTPMVDSFMTFGEALLFRAKQSDDLKFFDALTDPLKAVALENAYKNILKLKFDFGGSYTSGVDISGYNASQFNALPASFKDAVKNAQLAEADSVVENSPIREKIRDGVISETIGESSMFFSQKGSALTNTKIPGLSDEAYSFIKDWLFQSASSAQIWRLARA